MFRESAVLCIVPFGNTRGPVSPNQPSREASPFHFQILPLRGLTFLSIMAPMHRISSFTLSAYNPVEHLLKRKNLVSAALLGIIILS
jgi:hypothetical protein